MANAEFYKALVVPFNDQVTEDPAGNEVQFVNPVDAAEHFVKLITMLARLTERSATLTEQVKTLEVHKNRKLREIGRLRKTLMAKYYDRLTKTASAEVMDAFIHSVAEEDGPATVEKLSTLEQEVEDIVREIEKRTPRLEEYKSDQKLIERTGEYLKQALDFWKLEMRINNQTHL